MPSPAISGSTSVVPLSGDTSIDALLARTKWGGALGSGAIVTFSFPWSAGSSASFSGYAGREYSIGEPTATEHHGFNASEATAARDALQGWANIANIAFSEVADTSTDVGDIRFGWTSARLVASSGTQAWTGYPSANPAAGDIWFSTIDADHTSWVVGSANYRILMHEIGHAIGLKHPFKDSPTLPVTLDTVQYSVMAYTPAAHSLFVKVIHNENGSVWWQSHTVHPETPMLLDIAAIQYIYGANLGYRTGDDIYTFDPSAPFMKTIWDAGGNDTISVANFSRGSTIDLRPGRYSSIAVLSDSTAGYDFPSPPPTPTYDGTDNLGIAYGAVIENAIGGAGNDVLRGNDVANRLEGGAGNDTLSGLAGDDLLDGGSGRDTALVETSVSKVQSYSIANGVVAVTTDLGTLILTNIERVQFGDALFALDTYPGEHTWQAAALFHAGFGVLPGRADLSHWTAQADASAGMGELAQHMIDAYAPGVSSHDLVAYLYRQLMQQAASADVIQRYVDQIGAGKTFATQGELVAFAANLSLNTDGIAAIVGTVQQLDANAF